MSHFFDTSITWQKVVEILPIFNKTREFYPISHLVDTSFCLLVTCRCRSFYGTMFHLAAAGTHYVIDCSIVEQHAVVTSEGTMKDFWDFKNEYLEFGVPMSKEEAVQLLGQARKLRKDFYAYARRIYGAFKHLWPANAQTLHTDLVQLVKELENSAVGSSLPEVREDW